MGIWIGLIAFTSGDRAFSWQILAVSRLPLYMVLHFAIWPLPAPQCSTWAAGEASQKVPTCWFSRNLSLLDIFPTGLKQMEDTRGRLV